MKRTEVWDVVIIGGGPAGTSAACVLGEQGRRVLLLEREKFPRYHIGESMIPFTYPALERIGMIPRLRESSFVKKYSVQFVSPSGKASQPFYFFNRYDRETVAQSWQVLRSDFDQMMMEQARSKGAEVREQHEVVELLREEGRYVGVLAKTSGGEILEVRAPITIDASGREAIAATRNAWRRGDPKLNKVAVWTYYEGSLRDSGIDEGQTTVAFIPDKGWFWHIPQHGDRVSVGVVADGKYLTRDGVKDPRAIFEREIPQNQWIASRLATGRCVGEYWLTAEYTFRSQYSAADGLVLAGDAYGFLDPVFSSGLMLALKSGVAAADAAEAAFQAGDFRAARFTEYSRLMHEGIENMRKLIYAFYDPTVSFRTVTDASTDLAGDLTDCLSGDVNKDFSRLFSAFSEITRIPEPLNQGFPLPAETPRLVAA
ncbi:MAG: NAD(P)/FAD-dependent oxidoreductase [Verrucomicrobiota bacterium]